MLRMSVVIPACLVASLVSAGFGSAPPSPAPVSCLAETAYGTLSGLDQGATCAFLSVPFAAPPIGPNRWRPPQPLAPWSPSVRSAVTPVPNCSAVQLPAGTFVGQEDCLYLNVWVSDPAPSTPAPVIVWLHTGAFSGASANFAGTNGTRLAQETGVIVVEPNYRLGPFGFLAHAALETEDPHRRSTGNYGLLDQRAALEWVQGNIAAFGGDPDNVTLAGTSAGGQSVGLHLVAPGSDGLFQKAIVESAHPTTLWSTRNEAVQQGNAFATALACTDPSTVLTCMRAASRNQVLAALGQGTQQIVAQPGRIYWEPVVDGLVLPDQPRTLYERGEFSSVPLLVGANRDEGWGQFIRRSFPNGVSQETYETWLKAEFGWAAPVLWYWYWYFGANLPSAEEVLALVVGDGQFLCEARRLADLVANGGRTGRGSREDEEEDEGNRVKNDVYLYSYEYELVDPGVDHVIHGLESNILFGNGYVTPAFTFAHALTARDNAVHDVMAGYWTRFAATGDPNGKGLAKWPLYRKNQEEHFVIDDVVSAGENLGGGRCEIWSYLSLRSMLGTLPAID